jgi:glutamine synthetase
LVDWLAMRAKITAMLTVDELRQDVERGAIDTVVAALPDMQGRLMGKRIHARFFLDDTLEHGLEGCAYLLATDMDTEPQPGYQLANWDQGYGDFVATPDLSTLRRTPWLEGTALVLCDVTWADGRPVVPSPRAVLQAQVERARKAGFEPMVGTELEFFLFRESYAEAHARHYRNLTPSVPYILDYHVLATSYDEPLLRDIRNSMYGAGLPVESSKGEAWPGQHEINFRFASAVTAADNHVIFKNGAKEIAHKHGCAITFMAKPDHTMIGNSCHVHASLWSSGENAFAGETDVFRQFLAGWVAYARELALFLAPNVNSYKRYVAGSWAPTSLAWGYDNRSCGFRVVGHERSLRVETRIPGGDVNPYLCAAALIAAGLRGIDEGLETGPPLHGSAYDADVDRFPTSLYEAVEELERSTMAREAFGDEVVDHYLNYGRTEQRLFDGVVTCQERERMYERG